jgi:hypothetical protein
VAAAAVEAAEAVAVAAVVEAAVEAVAVEAVAVEAVAVAVEAVAGFDVWWAVYDAVKPVFARAIKEHPVVGPVAASMQQSGLDLLDRLIEIGRTDA